MMQGALLAAAAIFSAASAPELDIFLVPHTHCDAGWLWTVDSYYTTVHAKPSGEDTTHAAVRDTLTTVVRALAENPALRFNWAEIVFFEKWWGEQDATTQATTRRLVESGQLAFVGGGWVQADEVLTTASDQIRQTTLGNEWLRETFGAAARVRVGWQLACSRATRERRPRCGRWPATTPWSSPTTSSARTSTSSSGRPPPAWRRTAARCSSTPRSDTTVSTAAPFAASEA